jgi:hypothetical protein
VFEIRLCSLYSVLPLSEEQSTKQDVSCFITKLRASGKNTLKPLTLEVQFLEHHKTQYFDLHRKLQKIDYSQQTQAALQNFKTLLHLEIQLLLGCYVEWSVPLPQASADIDHPVLSTAGNYAYADESGGDAGQNSGAASPAAAAQAADPVATAPGVLTKDFTTWTPGTWELLPWDEIHLPKDPNVSICSVRSYMAIAMIMWYQPDLRLSQLRLWEQLMYAWNTTFHCDLHPNGLEKWQEDGPHAFNTEESKWLAETLCYFKRTPGRPARSGVRRALVSAPPPRQRHHLRQRQLRFLTVPVRTKVSKKHPETWQKARRQHPCHGEKTVCIPHP